MKKVLFVIAALSIALASFKLTLVIHDIVEAVKHEKNEREWQRLFDAIDSEEDD